MITLLTMLAAGAVTSADIRPLLRQQGLRDLVNGRETINYAGQIRQGRDNYQIYTYRGLFRAAVVDHGVNWLIVIRNGSVLLGGYQIPMPTECRVRGQRVMCNTRASGLIEFTKRGPPREILFDGEVLQFQHAAKLNAL